MDIIKVSATSRSSAVAGAIAGVIREHKHAEVQAIGAGAVNQAVKALAIATGYGVWAEVADAGTVASGLDLGWNVTIVVALMHFWYDGFIWSVRKRQV